MSANSFCPARQPKARGTKALITRELTVLRLINLLLRQLKAHTYSKWLRLQSNTTPLKHLVHISSAVPHGQNAS